MIFYGVIIVISNDILWCNYCVCVNNHCFRFHLTKTHEHIYTNKIVYTYTTVGSPPTPQLKKVEPGNKPTLTRYITKPTLTRYITVTQLCLRQISNGMPKECTGLTVSGTTQLL